MTSARVPLISGNWKMNKDHHEALTFVQKLHYLIPADTLEEVEVSIHPPFTALRTVQTSIDADQLDFALGAQHCHHETSGAFTGEVSPVFLQKLNVKYVICGHSERREIFGETDADVNAKVKAILAHGMRPIMCCGETLDERETGETESKVLGQIEAGLAGVADEQMADVVIAYEPIWAIGTGKTATSDDAQAVCAAIRAKLIDLYDDAVASSVRIQYGGSVKPGNATELMAQPDIDGALVGGASLVPEDFASIVGFGD